MTIKNKTILIYCILILLAAALIASNRFINPKKDSIPEKSYTERLAELKTDLMQAAKAGSKKQPTSANTARSSTGKSRRAGST